MRRLNIGARRGGRAAVRTTMRTGLSALQHTGELKRPPLYRLGFVHHCVAVGSCTKAPFFLHLWTHELVHCCARPGQRLIRFLCGATALITKVAKQTIRQQISLTLNWLKHQKHSSDFPFTQVELPFLS